MSVLRWSRVKIGVKREYLCLMQYSSLSFDFVYVCVCCGGVGGRGNSSHCYSKYPQWSVLSVGMSVGKTGTKHSIDAEGFYDWS